MDIFEGKSWISGQGLNHVCIGIEDGKISSVKKILKGDKHTKFQGVLLPGAFDMHVHFRDNDLLDLVVPETDKIYENCIVMPNLIPPITSGQMASITMP